MMLAAHPVFFSLFPFLSFLGDKRRIYATTPAHMDPGPGSLGLNSAAQTPFFKQDVEFLMVCREERFHPDLSGCAVCSRVPYECVGLSVMGRKLSLQHLKGRNFQQTKHCRRQETCCCSSILFEYSSVCLQMRFQIRICSKRNELETADSVLQSTQKAAK